MIYLNSLQPLKCTILLRLLNCCQKTDSFCTSFVKNLNFFLNLILFIYLHTVSTKIMALHGHENPDVV